MLRRRAAEGKRPHSANTTLVCRFGSIDPRFFRRDFPACAPSELCTAVRLAPFMAGSSAPLLNLQEIQFVPRYMVAKTRGGAGYKMTLGKPARCRCRSRKRATLVTSYSRSPLSFLIARSDPGALTFVRCNEPRLGRARYLEQPSYPPASGNEGSGTV